MAENKNTDFFGGIFIHVWQVTSNKPPDVSYVSHGAFFSGKQADH